MTRWQAAVATLVVAGVVLIGWQWLRSPGQPQGATPSAAVSVVSPPEAQSRLELRVTFEGHPIADARVTLLEPGLATAPVAVQTTDAAGWARFGPLPSASYPVRVRHDDYAEHRETVELIAEEVRREVALVRGVVIEGRVLDRRGTPVAASVRAIPLGAETEIQVAQATADGRFRLSGLPAGSYRVRAVAPRHPPAESGAIHLPRAGGSERVELVVEDGATIAGRVVDGSGQAVADAHVGASHDGVGVVRTDADGRFELAGLSNEAVNLFATAPGFAPRQLTGLRPGTRGVEIVLEAPASVSGRVTAAKINGSVLVSVCRFDEHFEKELCIARASVDPPYDFRLEDLPSGRFDVVVEAPGHDTARQSITLSPGQNFSVGLVEISAL